VQIFLSLTEWKRLVNTYGMSSAAAAAKSNTDFHSLRTKAEARGLLPSNFLILLLLDHRRGIKKNKDDPRDLRELHHSGSSEHSNLLRSSSQESNPEGGGAKKNAQPKPS
jgi:hypothetical protein